MTTSIWHLSSTRQLKKVALAAAPGAKAQFFAGDTTTPLTTYTDAGASMPHNTASLITDGNGLWPAVFVPYGSYNYRILDFDDTIIASVTNVPNPAPVDPTISDPNASLQTGDMIFLPAAITRAGFVRANGNTVGSGASSATERANDDAEALFNWLWNNLTNAQASVASGRGTTAAADWAANKTIATPDLRGSHPIGLDEMGAAAASRFGSATFGHGNATTGGSEVGSNTVTLLEANIPAHTHGIGTIATVAAGQHSHPFSATTTSNGLHNHAISDPTHAHTIPTAGADILIQSGTANLGTNASGGSQLPSGSTFTQIHGTAVIAAATGVSIQNNGSHNHTISGLTNTVAAHTHTLSGATAFTGSGTAANIVSRAILGTYLIKL